MLRIGFSRIGNAGRIFCRYRVFLRFGPERFSILRSAEQERPAEFAVITVVFLRLLPQLAEHFGLHAPGQLHGIEFISGFGVLDFLHRCERHAAAFFLRTSRPHLCQFPVNFVARRQYRLSAILHGGFVHRLHQTDSGFHVAFRQSQDVADKPCLYQRIVPNIENPIPERTDSVLVISLILLFNLRLPCR